MILKNIFCKDKKRKKDEFINEYVSQMQLLKSSNIKLRDFYGVSKKLPIQKNLLKIIKASDNIFKELTESTNKISKMNLFIEYYIQEVIKILDKYLKIVKLKDSESKEMCKMIEKFIECVATSFEKIYRDLISYDKTDMEIDIEVMLKELKTNLGEQ